MNNLLNLLAVWSQYAAHYASKQNLFSRVVRYLPLFAIIYFSWQPLEAYSAAQAMDPGMEQVSANVSSNYRYKLLYLSKKPISPKVCPTNWPTSVDRYKCNRHR